jgi:D-aminopeptidase
VATDAPLGGADLARLARRAGLGLARTGSVAHHGSGEIFLAFSTARPGWEDEPAVAGAGEASPGHEARGAADLDALFAAAVDATEEAVINALWHAETTTGREGRVVPRLPHDAVLDLLRAHGRLA